MIAKSGLLIIALIFTTSFIAPLFIPATAFNYDLPNKLQSSSMKHALGTDENGCDVLAKIIYGGRLSLTIAFIVVAISSAIGLALGSIAGYNTGATNQIIMRSIDMLQAFPGFLLALALIAFLGSNITNVIIALTLTGWTPYARLVAGEVQSLKDREFISAARAIGVGPLKIIAKHLWPNVMAVLSVQISFGLAATVISEGGLSFLGLGAPPDTPSWGTLLNSGRRYIIQAPTLSLYPGLAIVILVLGFNLLGDGLQKHFNPRP